jgi:hypothetical protein
MITNLIIGILVVMILVTLALWQVIRRWLVARRLALSGRVVEAHVTDIKREARLVAQTGGVATTFQRQQYEDFLYAQWKDPLTTHVYTFRVKIRDFSAFHIGETIAIVMNRNNPNEYKIHYSGHRSAAKKPMPKPGLSSHTYQQGYAASLERTKSHNDMSNSSSADEKPEAAYPQMLLEQKHDDVI